MKKFVENEDHFDISQLLVKILTLLNKNIGIEWKIPVFQKLFTAFSIDAALLKAFLANQAISILLIFLHYLSFISLSHSW